MIEKVVDTLLSKLKDIVSSETVVGKPIQAGETTIVPVTKISVGFGAGSGGKDDDSKGHHGTGTGGGASIEPVAIITVHQGDVKIHLMNGENHGIKKIIDLVPGVIEKFSKNKPGEKTKEKN